MQILSTSKVLPFQINDKTVGESHRLKHRFLDLRNDKMRENILMRYKIIAQMRRYLDEQDFVEIETPTLSK
jgi:aspartyl-tRNA synthetase